MRPTSCRDIEPRLVDFADGELPDGENTAVAEHLASCPSCRTTLDTLKTSIDLAGLIWQEAESQLAKVQAPTTTRSPRRRARRASLVAACALLMLSGAALWHVLSESDQPVMHADAGPTLEEIRRTIDREAISAQLLAAADMLAELPGGDTMAEERYRYVADEYADTEANSHVRARLQLLMQRRTVQ